MEHTEYSKTDNLHIRDEFLSDFVYPDGEFYKDSQPLDFFYEALKCGLYQLTEDEFKVVMVKACNRDKSFRELAKVCGISHEQFRKLWLRIRDVYPFIYNQLQSIKSINYNGNKNNKKERKAKNNKKENIIEESEQQEFKL